MQQQARPVAAQPQAPQPAPAGMQALTSDQLRSVVGGPVIKNGGSSSVQTTTDSAS